MNVCELMTATGLVRAFLYFGFGDDELVLFILGFCYFKPKRCRTIRVSQLPAIFHSQDPRKNCRISRNSRESENFPFYAFLVLYREKLSQK